MDVRSQEWIDQMSTKIREAFEIFDREKTETIAQEEIGSLMRYLGVYPTEIAIEMDILPAVIEDETPGLIPFRKFKKKMLQILADKKWQPDSRDIILQAFRVLDSQNKGVISAEYMESLLTAQGSPFTTQEMQTFLAAAKDENTDNIFYEDYVSLFPKDVY